MKLTLTSRLVAATAFVVASLAASLAINIAWLGNLLMIIASLVAVWPIAKKAFGAAKYKILGIDALVTLAVIGATIIGEYWEAAAVAILFLLGEYLEARALEKTRSAIKSLLEMAPLTARVIRSGKEVEVAPQDVKVGELVIVKPGEKIPVDGIVTDGSAYVNQSSITGESMPVQAKNGNEVYSGSIIESGFVTIKASKVGEDTMFARMLHMVEEAQDKKAKTQSFLEKFAKYYTPVVVILSLVVWAITGDTYLALTLLVIACPGALVIAAPVSIVAGIGNAAQNGILIKGGDAIEKAARIKTIAFDKTGTLTIGKPEVVDSLAINISKKQLLQIAASAEHYSEHPLAMAVISAAKLAGVKLTKPQSSDVIIGHGIAANLDGQQAIVGNAKLLNDNNVEVSKKASDYVLKQQKQGRTVVLVASAGELIGALAIADTVREDAKETIAKLQASGKKVAMLTGDATVVAKAIAKQLGISEYYAELLPEGKVKKLQELEALRPGSVAMVGDGVNDAPALAVASLGVAVGGPGKDIAMETADVVLLSGNINRLTYALNLARATTGNMRQNIYFAVAVVVALLTGVLAQVVFLSSGMLLHVVSVLLVIINALRLLRYNSKQ